MASAPNGPPNTPPNDTLNYCLGLIEGHYPISVLARENSGGFQDYSSNLQVRDVVSVRYKGTKHNEINPNYTKNSKGNHVNFHQRIHKYIIFISSRLLSQALYIRLVTTTAVLEILVSVMCIFLD